MGNIHKGNGRDELAVLICVAKVAPDQPVIFMFNKIVVAEVLKYLRKRITAGIGEQAAYPLADLRGFFTFFFMSCSVSLMTSCSAASSQRK